MSAIGGLLTIIRKDDKGTKTKHLGGYFSAILDKNQSRLLACECEALSVKEVHNHFEPEVSNSDNTTTHECDNMPTVLAWRKMLKMLPICPGLTPSTVRVLPRQQSEHCGSRIT